MAITNIIKSITLDVYDHDKTPKSIKSIAADNDTRYIAAEIQCEGVRYDIGESAAVKLIILRPDKVGVEITGSPYAFSYETPGSYNPETGEETPGETITYYGVYAELDQAALVKSGTLLGQFKITSGEQVLRTELFKVNNGRALDTETSDWAGEYQGYNLDELVQSVNTTVATVEGMETDVSQLKEGLEDIAGSVEGMETDVSQLKEGLEDIAGSAYVTDSASGAVAHFTDGADDVPLKSLNVNIVPVQSGSGDPSPSNVRPISGWDSVTVTRAGKNLLEPWITSQVKNGVTYTMNSDGTIVTSRQATANSQILSGRFSLPAGNYVLSGCPSGGSGGTYFLRALLYNGNTLVRILNSDYGTGATFTISESEADCELIVFTAIQNGNTVNATWKPMIEVGTSVTAYEPYHGNTYTISLSSAGTVYGGMLDVVSGELKVTHGYIASYSGQTLPSAWISDRDVYADGTIPTTGAHVVYQLATPITYNLTPTEIRSLLGVNNIWSDAGDVEVEYRADTKLYINKLTKSDTDMIADANITSGKYFMVGNNLYKATANIANGAQIIVGTNCISKSLSEALNEINA